MPMIYGSQDKRTVSHFSDAEMKVMDAWRESEKASRPFAHTQRAWTLSGLRTEVKPDFMDMNEWLGIPIAWEKE